MKTKSNLLPAHYTKVNEPNFQGKGCHSVAALEDIAEQYKELVHQLRIEKQALWDISNVSLEALRSAKNHLPSLGDNTLAEIEKAISNATGESKIPASESDFDWTTHGDFKKYYDTTQKRNIWVLGYFGGGSVNICDAYHLSKQYAEATGVPLENVKIDEILSSRRFKGFKFLYSNDVQASEAGSEQMENVYAWLRD